MEIGGIIDKPNKLTELIIKNLDVLIEISNNIDNQVNKIHKTKSMEKEKEVKNQEYVDILQTYNVKIDIIKSILSNVNNSLSEIV